jgi:hypothetical protein
VRAP